PFEEQLAAEIIPDAPRALRRLDSRLLESPLDRLDHRTVEPALPARLFVDGRGPLGQCVANPLTRPVLVGLLAVAEEDALPRVLTEVAFQIRCRAEDERSDERQPNLPRSCLHGEQSLEPLALPIGEDQRVV